MMALHDRGLGSNYNVLIDSGANEVVRPYNSTWWSEICVYNSKGRMVSVTLVGGMTSLASMTQHGEIMLKDRGLYSKGWIMPVYRLSSELGIKLTWPNYDVTLVTAGCKFKKRKSCWRFAVSALGRCCCHSQCIDRKPYEGAKALQCK